MLDTLLKNKPIPQPTIKRLCKIFTLLEETDEKEKKIISSKELGDKIGVKSFSIRKDFTYLPNFYASNSGYNILTLKKDIAKFLGLNRHRTACVIGLNNLGEALINYNNLFTTNFKIIAGFDQNINKIETLKTEIPLYPTYEIIEIIKEKKIDLAVLTLSSQIPSKIIERLAKSQLKGIINFSPAILNLSNPKIYIRNIDIEGEFKFLSSLFTLNHKLKNIII